MKIKLLILSIAIFGIAHAQSTWTQRANFGGGVRQSAVCFSIGTKGYIGTGFSGTNKQDLWEWNQVTDTWTQKANFPGPARQQLAGFSIGTKGYLGTGWTPGAMYNDFWEWNQTTNIWVQKANFGGTGRRAAVSFSIGTKGYIGTGNDGSFMQDFWEWDQATDTWAQKANFGGTGREDAVGFSIGTKGYIGTGYDGNDKKNDFWEWDQTTDSWIQKADFGGTPRQAASGFSISNKGYIGTGYDGAGWQQDFWEWDPSINQWFQRADFGGTGRWDAVGFSVGTKGYIGTGFDGLNMKNDFWEFNPVSSPPICLVTVDSLSHYNIIAWDKTPYTDVDSFIIYREYTTNNYLPIGAVSYNSLSQFTDTVRTQYFPVTGDPNISSYRYKLQIRDINGNYSSLGLYHNTIHILNNNGNFSWNFYEIENTPNPVTFYELKRDNLNDGHWITVAGVAGTQNSITDPQYSTYQNTANWRIETQWNISCDLTRTTSGTMTAINKSRSNLLKTNSTGIKEVAFESMISISPNPSNGKFTIELSSSGVSNDNKYVVKIYNVLGEQTYLSELKQLTRNEIDLSHVPKGIYFVNVYIDNKIYIRKIVKQ
ncbi:MAG: T9SS type A sorting domain-containing protein [Bacteroidota bacterium]